MTQTAPIFKVNDLSLYYDEFRALREISMEIKRYSITALIGPSGCGKSSLLRCFNRMNDLIPSAKIDGQILFEGSDLYDDEVDATEIRSRIGMVFQRPNPFPKSIYDNVAFGLKVNGFMGDMDEAIERSLRQPRCGKRSRTGSEAARWSCRADSSSGCASRARWRWSRR